MRNPLIRAARSATRTAPATLAVAAAAFSLGAYSGNAAARSARPSFSLGLRAKVLTVNRGSTAQVSIVIHRHRLRAQVTLKLSSRLPHGVSVQFSPRRTRGRRIALTLGVSSSARIGRYQLRLRALGGHVRRTVTLTLNIGKGGATTQSPTGEVPQLAITGSAGSPLEPGAAQPIDVLITNPNDLQLAVTSLSVSVQAITAPRATPALPCTLGDFAVRPYSGTETLNVPASSSRTLSELGVPSDQWPEVSLADLPSNQDGCQGASLSLAYSADARLG